MKLGAAACALICLVAWTIRADELDPYAEFDDITLDQPSPHVAWGIPLDGGPIRALFIAPRFTLRDVVELSERLDLKNTAVAPVWDAGHLGNDESEIPNATIEETASCLRDQLRRERDILVVGNLDLSILPEDVLDTILERVQSGAGLLLAQYGGILPDRVRTLIDGLVPEDSAEAITRGVGESLTPEWPSSLGFVKSGTFGQGRVVVLEYGQPAPRTHFLIPSLTEPLKARPEYFDTYLSLVAKAARWAAHRDPPIAVAQIDEPELKGPADSEIPPDLPEDYVKEVRDAAEPAVFQSFRVQLKAPADRTYRVQAQVRDPQRGQRRVYPNLPQLEKGASAFVVELPIGPGQYFLDLWFFHKKAVVEWHTAPVAVKGWPDLSGLAYSKGHLLANDTLTVSMTVRPQYHRPRPCTVYVRATDSAGRLVAENRQTLSQEGGHAEVVLQFVDLIANLVKVEVFAADTRAPVPRRWDLDRAAYDCHYFPVRALRPARAFSFAVEGRALSEYNARTFARTLAHWGVDSVSVPFAADSDTSATAARFYLAELNLRPIPELARGAPEKIEDGIVRVPCLTDPVFRQAEDKRLREAAPGFWTAGTQVYSLGAGNCLTPGEDEVCQSPTCLEGFRAVLRKEYGSLDRLNAAWGAQWPSWENVRPATRDHYAPWLDFRLYMDSVFAQAQARQSGIIHEVDLDARAGFRARSGSSAYRGYDWWLLASQLDAVALEPDPVTVEMVRSYKPASAYTALCFGGDADTDSAAYARWLPWYAALHGMPAVWHTAPFGGSSLTTGAVALAPDGLCSPTFAEAADTIAELKSGLGALLLSAVRKKPAVAIYGSQASLYLSQIDPAFGDCRAAERAFMKLLEQAGRAYDFVSYAQARQGKLREYALAILPATRALSDEELEALRTFHAQGGRLIADIAPGEFDGHGIRRASYPLDGLFGIRHTGPPKPGAPAESFVELSTERGTTSGVLDGLIADSAVEPTDAVVSGKTQHGTPLWLLQGADKVATALLNHTMQTYPLESEQGALLFRLFDALLTRTGVECSAPAIAENGGPLPCACTVLHYGEADIVTLLRDAGEGGKTERVLLRFEDDRHVYDARQGKHLMRPKHVREDLRPGDARVLTALPYEVTGLTVTTEDSVQAGRRLTVAVSVNARKATPGTHLVHVTLRQGFGQPIPYYAHDVSCREGEGATFIPLALDEAPGVYTIEARDLLTGTTGQALLKVEGRTPPK